MTPRPARALATKATVAAKEAKRVASSTPSPYHTPASTAARLAATAAISTTGGSVRSARVGASSSGPATAARSSSSPPAEASQAP